MNSDFYMNSCPRCENKPLQPEQHNIPNGSGKLWRVSCPHGCIAVSRDTPVEAVDAWERSREAMLDFWNT